MTILILGAGGMLGHRLWLTARQRHQAVATARRVPRELLSVDAAAPRELIGGVDAAQFDSVVRAFAQVMPAVVVNCIGIVKQRAEATDPAASLMINALFPHRLAQLCQATRARLIHVSTDCVFDGAKGRYRETDPSSAEDLYGRTKYLGEVHGPGVLTVRTSMIGRELGRGQGLVEWFLGQNGPSVLGYRRAVFSGVTTHELARVLMTLTERYASLDGLYHVAAEPIAKSDLLALLNEVFERGCTIRPVDEPAVDRSLDGSRFREATGWTAPSWRDMVHELATDASFPYEARAHDARR